MTSNHQRAVETLNKHWGIAKETGMADETECCVKALEEAGLVTPDQPEPDNHGKSGQYHMAEWLPLGTGLENPIVWTAAGAGRVMIQRIEPGELTPEETRKVALALLAAANYTEQEQPSGNV